MPVKKTPPRKKAGEDKKIPKKKVGKAKPSVKKPRKKVVKKKISTKKVDKKELKKAVDKLPGLIVEKVKLEKKEVEPEQIIEQPKDVIEIRELKPTGETKTRVGQNYDDGRDRKWLMWLGVIIFTIAILVLWGWNLIVKFQDTTNTGELGIINNVKEDIQTTLNTPEQEASEVESAETKSESDEDIKEKIKQNLANILADINTEPTTTTTETEKLDTEEQTKTTENNNDIITPSL